MMLKKIMMTIIKRESSNVKKLHDLDVKTQFESGHFVRHNVQQPVSADSQSVSRTSRHAGGDRTEKKQRRNVEQKGF